MLAKLWKKVLLTVCIVACLFNITHKLVNRHSLKENLQSVNDGETIFDLSRDKSSSSTDSSISKGDSSNNDSGGSSSENDGESYEGQSGTHKNKGYYDEDGVYRLYEDDENVESSEESNDGDGSEDESENYDNADNGDGDGNSFNIKDSLSNAKDKIQNIDIDVEPAEPTEVYEDIPVYEEGNPQREAGNNSEYSYSWRDFLDIFKSN